jgi:hypothetical protein
VLLLALLLNSIQLREADHVLHARATYHIRGERRPARACRSRWVRSPRALRFCHSTTAIACIASRCVVAIQERNVDPGSAQNVHSQIGGTPRAFLCHPTCPGWCRETAVRQLISHDSIVSLLIGTGQWVCATAKKRGFRKSPSSTTDPRTTDVTKATEASRTASHPIPCETLAHHGFMANERCRREDLCLPARPEQDDSIRCKSAVRERS